MVVLSTKSIDHAVCLLKQKHEVVYGSSFSVLRDCIESREWSVTRSYALLLGLDRLACNGRA